MCRFVSLRRLGFGGKVRPLPAYWWLLLALAGSRAAWPLHAGDIDKPPIAYATTPAKNVITELEVKLHAKTVQLEADAEFGYLKALLRELAVPTSTQVLVFSKTSLQRNRIGPKTPRAIYFSDDVTIGYCQGGPVMEVAVADANLGTVFYSLDQTAGRPPKFTRQGESCLLCHGSSRNHGMPGHLLRSTTVDRRGELLLTSGIKPVDHTTPFKDRWGGWYVTGTSGKQTHLGNSVEGGWSGSDKATPNTNVTDLKPYFDITKYPTPHSDLVALLVLEHQCETQNRLTRANFLTRQALHEQAELNRAAGQPLATPHASITKRIDEACEPVVRHFLFCEEAKLTEPVAGTSTFAKDFAARGPFDAQKRSLRAFDLQTRLFKYPLSYLIYSAQFASLPAAAKERIERRLWEVLQGRDKDSAFNHLTKDDRRAVLAILRVTKPDLPAYWRD